MSRKGKQRVARTRNGGRWTEARYKGFIVSALRNASVRWGPKSDCIRAAYIRDGINPRTGRQCKLHECARCGGEFPKKDMRADHVSPVVDPVEGFQDWDTFIERLFVEQAGFQAVCVECHKEKTAAERLIRFKKLTPERAVRRRSRKKISRANTGR